MGILTDKTCSRFWDELNRHVMRTGAIPATLNQLSAIILYDRITTTTRRRCLAVVNIVGGHAAARFDLTPSLPYPESRSG